MKKSIAFIALLFGTMSVSAQFYGSLSGGRTIAANEQVLGQETTTFGINSGTNKSTHSSDLEGSYGEGLTAKLRLGYFFNETIGIELGVGYLHGFLQNVNKNITTSIYSDDASAVVNIDDIETLDQWARGRAFGASLSAVVNVAKNVYVRAGLLTKIAGYTELITDIDLTSSGLGAVQVVNEFNGKVPLGFIGGLGYKYKLTDKIDIFAEVEYMNINVKRDVSNRTDLTFSDENTLATVAAIALSQEAAGDPSLALLLSNEEVQWGENDLPAPKAPYSSLGLNIGVTYNF